MRACQALLGKPRLARYRPETRRKDKKQDKGLNNFGPAHVYALLAGGNVIYLIKRRRILEMARGKKTAQKTTK